MHQVGPAVSRFFGFFFALLITIAVVIASYAIVAGQPIQKTWNAVEALLIASVVVLALALVADRVPGWFERRMPSGAAMHVSPPTPAEETSQA